jgi:hypothetical protein
MAPSPRRLELQTTLEAVLGSPNVYFQPPTNVQMQFPCIIYRQDAAITRFADNKPFRYSKRYQVTVVDSDPDSQIPDKIAELPTTTFNRFFIADNLNHYVFNVYF